MSNDATDTPPTDDDSLRPLRDGEDRDYAKLKSVDDQIQELIPVVRKAYEDKAEQSDGIDRRWDIYNCVLNDNQAYSGTTQAYLPLVKDAVKARARYFSRMMFPQNGNYVAVISQTGDIPHATMALMNHYIRKARLRQVIPSLFLSGDIEGQYILAVDWMARTRHVSRLVDVAQKDEFGGDIEGTEVEQEIEDEISDQRPGVQVLAAEDVVFLPTNVEHTDDCEITARRLHLTKEMVEAYIEDGIFNAQAGQQLLDSFKAAKGKGDGAEKRSVENAGVKYDRAMEIGEIIQVWCFLRLPKIGRRRCVFHYWGDTNVLGCHRNPFANDRVPVFGAPREKVRGSIWGEAAVSEGVETLQYAANDAINMGNDSAQYALMPIVMTDPEQNPRLSSVVMSMMAIWEVSPQHTELVTLPPIWKDALLLASAYKDQIMQSLAVTPAMLPHGHSGKKPSQAQVAQDQQTAQESVADEVETVEATVMSDLLRWFIDLDAQFRTDELLVHAYGRMGLRAKLERVPADQRAAERHTFLWIGSEAFKSAQRTQQKIALVNVARGIPPNQMGGLQLNMAPILQSLFEEYFGPETAPLALIDPAEMNSLEPETENELLASNIPIPVSPFDDDRKHILSHQKAMGGAQDPAKSMLMSHLGEHAKALQMKAMAQQQQTQAGHGLPGAPGGSAPGIAGTPRIGAQPGQGRPLQQPPGAVHQDRLALAMPRRAGP